MELDTQLRELVSEISPTEDQRDNLRDAHIRLREALMADQALKPLIVGTLLQGSYRRHTGIRPESGDKPDVDVVVVTRLNRCEYTPEAAMDTLIPFLDRHYPGMWKKKGRSIGIELPKVKLDVVLTSAPSETEESAILEFLQWEGDGDIPSRASNEWKNAPLWIPDRDARTWQRTHPLEQIRWTHEKNASTNGHYIHVVKLVKWWWQTRHPEQEYPRSYPLEHIVGDCCPDGVTSLAQAFTETLEEIERRYRRNASIGAAPCLSDRGVPEQNVLSRMKDNDFIQFHKKSGAAADVARKAINSVDEGESAKLWGRILGSRYPVQKGFTSRDQTSQFKGGRFA